MGHHAQKFHREYADPSHDPNKTRWILVAVVAIASAVYFWGIRKDLPFTPGSDEPDFVTRAVHIAASGSLNPGWFGHPGSTVIYPLALAYHIWYAVVHDGMIFRPDPMLQSTFQSNPGEFYVLGRFLTVSFAILTVPLVYQLGRRAFGEYVGITGSFLSMLPVVLIAHAQLVRTDSAATFFGVLSLWLLVNLYDRPIVRNHVAAGLAIGLSTATRYLMVTLLPILLVANGLLLVRTTSSSLKPKLLSVSAGLAAIVAAFALTTPYFFLDHTTAMRDLRVEARSSHLGADGLSPLGNFLWYATTAIPQSITWPLAILAAVGIALVVWRRRPPQMLLLGFVAVFLAGISLSPLHWQRWLIPILPLLGLLSADAMNTGVGHLCARLEVGSAGQRRLLLASILLVAALPAYEVALWDIGQANPSTRVLAREWILRSLPSGSRIAQEWYTAPLDGTGFVLLQPASLPEKGSLQQYYQDGYRYLVASSYMYGRFFAEPNRYTSQIAFYQNLFEQGELLQEFKPSATRAGPVIRIYRLRGEGQ